MRGVETIIQGRGLEWTIQARMLKMFVFLKKKDGWWGGLHMVGDVWGKKVSVLPVQAFSLVSTVWNLTRCSGLLPLLWCSHICR